MLLIKVILTKVQEQPLDLMRSIDLVDDLVPEEDIFDTVEDAFDYLRKKLG